MYEDNKCKVTCTNINVYSINCRLNCLKNMAYSYTEDKTFDWDCPSRLFL